MESLRKKIVIIGGGAGGVSIANFLSRYLTSSTEISLIEPQENHFFSTLLDTHRCGPREGEQ